MKCITLRNKGTVRINECTTVKARSEQVINVRCSKRFSMLCVDFEPRQIPGVTGVSVSKARVLPNMEVFDIECKRGGCCLPRKIVGAQNW